MLSLLLSFILLLLFSIHKGIHHVSEQLIARSIPSFRPLLTNASIRCVVQLDVGVTTIFNVLLATCCPLLTLLLLLLLCFLFESVTSRNKTTQRCLGVSTGPGQRCRVETVGQIYRRFHSLGIAVDTAMLVEIPHSFFPVACRAKSVNDRSQQEMVQAVRRRDPAT
jgi:hypothetical protein